LDTRNNIFGPSVQSIDKNDIVILLTVGMLKILDDAIIPLV